MAFLRGDGTYEVAQAPRPPAAFAAEDPLRRIITAEAKTIVTVLAYAASVPKGNAALPGGQPANAGTTVGVWDGDVTNFPQVAADLGLAPEGGEPPDLLLPLVQMALERPTRGYEAAEIAARLRLLDGSFALAAWDSAHPRALLLARYRRPLQLWRDREYGALYFSNRAEPLPLRLRRAARVTLRDNQLWWVGAETRTPPRAKIFPEARRPRGPAAPPRASRSPGR
jgi:hypothetical protein